MLFSYLGLLPFLSGATPGEYPADPAPLLLLPVFSPSSQEHHREQQHSQDTAFRRLTAGTVGTCTYPSTYLYSANKVQYICTCAGASQLSNSLQSSTYKVLPHD